MYNTNPNNHASTPFMSKNLPAHPELTQPPKPRAPTQSEKAQPKPDFVMQTVNSSDDVDNGLETHNQLRDQNLVGGDPYSAFRGEYDDQDYIVDLGRLSAAYKAENKEQYEEVFTRMAYNKHRDKDYHVIPFLDTMSLYENQIDIRESPAQTTMVFDNEINVDEFIRLGSIAEKLGEDPYVDGEKYGDLSITKYNKFSTPIKKIIEYSSLGLASKGQDIFESFMDVGHNVLTQHYNNMCDFFQYQPKELKINPEIELPELDDKIKPTKSVLQKIINDSEDPLSTTIAAFSDNRFKPLFNKPKLNFDLPDYKEEKLDPISS